MDQNLETVLALGFESMDDAVEHLRQELSNIRAGKAHPGLVSGLMVDYYGSPTPLNQVANVTASDSTTISIQPWEKSMLAPIEKSIFEANLGITPMNNGEVVLLTIPPLTEERRKGLVKNAKAIGEDAKVSVRNSRQKSMEAIKKEVKNGYPEDAGKRKEAEVQKAVDNHISMIDELVAAKEKDIMKV